VLWRLGERYYDGAYFKGVFAVRHCHKYIYVFKPEVLGSSVNAGVECAGPY